MQAKRPEREGGQEQNREGDIFHKRRLFKRPVIMRKPVANDNFVSKIRDYTLDQHKKALAGPGRQFSG
jgi:hypothetical protein